MIEQADLETARLSVPNDACFVVSALAGHAIRLIESDPARNTVSLPAVCERCLLDAVPTIIEQATGRACSIEWQQPWPTDASATSSSLAAATIAASKAASSPDADEATPAPAPVTLTATLAAASASVAVPPRTRIGIVGNALLCFDPFMNDHLADFIRSQGCDVVFPNPALLVTDDVRYFAQLDRFAEQGVRHVIYLQSFGCLKGHVQARGALHELARRYPAMPITVIDYDPEASALNRENRVRLALAAATRPTSSAE